MKTVENVKLQAHTLYLQAGIVTIQERLDSQKMVNKEQLQVKAQLKFKEMLLLMKPDKREPHREHISATRIYYY